MAVIAAKVVIVEILVLNVYLVYQAVIIVIHVKDVMVAVKPVILVKDAMHVIPHQILVLAAIPAKVVIVEMVQHVLQGILVLLARIVVLVRHASQQIAVQKVILV